MQGRPLVGAWPLAAVRLTFLALASALLLATTPAPAADLTPKGGADTSIKITPFPPSVQVDTAMADEDADNTDRRHRRHRAVIGIDSDRDFESFKQAMNTAPWIVGLIFLVVGSIFLTPVILLIGIVWYKLRKTRLQNDALLMLAERGVMPPAQAVEAVSSGVMPAALASEATASGGAPASGTAGAAASATAATSYQQAVATRKLAVWSDLRKGVLLCAVGLSFVMYSMIGSGSPNWPGLLLLFVGVAYVILWWLEERHITQRSPDKATD